MCGSRKYPCPLPPQRIIGNTEGEGVSKPKIFRGMGGSNQKTLHGGSMDISYWNNTIHPQVIHDVGQMVMF